MVWRAVEYLYIYIYKYIVITARISYSPFRSTVSLTSVTAADHGLPPECNRRLRRYRYNSHIRRNGSRRRPSAETWIRASSITERECRHMDEWMNPLNGKQLCHLVSRTSYQYLYLFKMLCAIFIQHGQHVDFTTNTYFCVFAWCFMWKIRRIEKNMDAADGRAM